MYVDTFTATASVRRHVFRLERDFKVLLLKRISVTKVAGNLQDGCPETLSLIITDHAANRTDSVNRVNLGAMAFYKQLGEGALFEEYNHPDHPGKFVSNLPLVFTGDAGLHITSDDQCNFEIDGGIVGAVYELHLYETPFYGSNILEYTAVTNLGGSKRKSIDVDNVIGLIIPINSGINRIIQKFGHGGTAETDLDELRQKNGQMNDIESRQKVFGAVIENQLAPEPITRIYGSEESQFVFLDCGNITHVDIDSGGGEFEVTQIRVLPRAV